ncbi:tetraspanin Pls1 family [Mycena belliarum]|uniref:Tetraspanin Pls1 family n=1 Tax=Mycena belliarum TaxID=1033014 RepID=A0AAD6U7K8_9AGAR|nr:tetraspanin Pls1 family [Mycena belliae]
MVSKGLMGAWAFIDFLLLAGGGMSIALSIVWRAPNILMNMALSPEFLTGGMVVGIALCATFLVSIGAVVQRNHVTVGFVILNYFLIVDSIIVLVVGTMIWFFSLRQRSEFHVKWQGLSDQDRITLQDKFRCCGYFGPSDPAFKASDVQVGGAFCVSKEFAASLASNNTANFCVSPVTTFTDYTLENTFTTIYGLMAVVLSLLVASLCVIKKRQEEERFKRIDAKRGGRGFV